MRTTRLVLVLWCSWIGACAQEAQTCARMQAEIQEMMEARASDYGFPGLVLGLDAPGCGRWIGTAGLASREPEEPMRPEHIVPVGSVSKMFVAVVVLGLVDEGVLSLDDRLSGWYPDVPGADAITLRHLLAHRSGLYNYFPDEHNSCYQEYADDPGRVWTPEELIDCTRDHPPEFPPGERFGYSNTNYVLLGSIVERTTGRGLYQQMHDRLFVELGMDRTFSKAAGSTEGVRARCYLGDTDISARFNPSFAFGCGGMESNADDLLDAVRAIATGDVQPAPLAEEMLACRDSGGYPMGDYGLGIACRDHDLLEDLLGHAGRGDGMAEVYYAKELDTALVVLVNHRFTDALWNRPTYLWSHDLAEILDRHRTLVAGRKD